MIDLLPLFPLKIVAYPGEELNLHIFEPRYKQLIGDVLKKDRNFGIPVFLKDVSEYGTAVQITEVSKAYDDGKMDIKTRGISVFKIEQFLNPIIGKLYAGAKVSYLENVDDGDPSLTEKIRMDLEHILSNANVSQHLYFGKNFSIYKIAHIIGLSLEEEYQLLKMQHEKDRQEYVLHHLDKIIPQVERIKEVKKRISGNGHFKNLDPLNF